MEGNTSDGYRQSAAPSRYVRTLVLVGKTGNGKSALGNSILRKQVFKSSREVAGVTSTCELQSVENDQILNVIDTPGLADFSAESDVHGKEITKCMVMAKHGISAVLVVLSVNARFTKEDEVVLRDLQNFFGVKILDYIIVVYTNGDALEAENITLDGYLKRDCPKPLESLLKKCQNRKILFDNRTKDEGKKSKQLKDLLSLVDMVLEINGNVPFTNDLFIALQEQEKLREEQEKLRKLHQEELDEITNKEQEKLREVQEKLSELHHMKLNEIETQKWKEIIALEKQLAESEAARREAEITVKYEKAAAEAARREADLAKVYAEGLAKALESRRSFLPEIIGKLFGL